MAAPPEYLTPAEAAALLRISTSQLARLAQAGRIESGKTPGGRYRYPSAQFGYLYAYLRGETGGQP